MKNISFGATLKVDENLYKKAPENTPKGYVEGVIDRYKNFIDHPNISKYLGEDTIELSKSKSPYYRNGYSVELKITPEDGSEPFEGGIFTNKKDSSFFRATELIRQTYQYIFYKLGIPEKFEYFWHKATQPKKIKATCG